ncbi:MAG: M23 family metallopeptidase [Alphaproteobacteria bacterium]|nr:M23 family metallopeptidase [Alphaproteobacteria bacterium]
MFAQDNVNCEINGIGDGAPTLCGMAKMGGFLHGESERDVFYGPDKISNNGVFVLGLPMDAPEIIELKFCKRKNCDTFAYSIEQRKYKEEKVTVPDKFIKYPPETEARIKRESDEIAKARESVRHDKSVEFMNLTMPENLRDVRISGVYGSRRVFNGEPKSPHKGVDWAAIRGTPVYPFANGVVILTGDHYMSGKIVIVSHGHWITTTYIHMDEIKVKIGDKVNGDTILGLVGGTGRSSGPHLHAQANWGPTAIDLELMLK